jgi:hypothetical protein
VIVLAPSPCTVVVESYRTHLLKTVKVPVRSSCPASRVRARPSLGETFAERSSTSLLVPQAATSSSSSSSATYLLHPSVFLLIQILPGPKIS